MKKETGSREVENDVSIVHISICKEKAQHLGWGGGVVPATTEESCNWLLSRSPRVALASSSLADLRLTPREKE